MHTKAVPCIQFWYRSIVLGMICLVASGCLGTPNNVSPVTAFELDRYLGTWHEIARLDHRFERGLEQVTATYALREDGGVSVLNKGLNRSSNEWKQAQGRAYLVGAPNIGHLKVSFFGPFFASYVVFETDPADYAFVSGPDHSYLWLLSRSPRVSPALARRFAQRATSLGFPADELIWVKQADGTDSKPADSTRARERR